MTPSDLEKLRNQIRYHDDLYHQKAKPEISDQEYDALLKKLLDLEALHPDWVTPDSPSQRVGGKPIDSFTSVRHAQRMMSIDNTYDESEVHDFDTRVRKLLGTSNFRYTCEPKIDGVSLSLRYESGLLTTAATRGDGTTGDDVTHNAKTIRNIPLRLKTQHSALSTQHSVVEVRGEVFIPRAQFAKINQAQEEAGEEAYANPRNTAAGTLKQLDPKIVASRKLEFLPHGAGEIIGLDITTYHQWQENLQSFGFHTSEYFKICEGVEDVLAYIRKFAETRKSLPYDTDGVVVKIDDFDQRNQLGTTAKSPRWCIAYKYQPERAETELVRVVFQVGKTGTITPVAEFEPAPFISGTNVYRASLHNFDEIDRKDIHLHDRVLIEKAGEVIPYVVGVVPEKRPKNAQKIERPTECPSCKNKDLEHDGGFVRCTNPDCPDQVAERIRFWTGRNQMDIAEIGPALIDQLLKSGLIKSIPDLYRLKKEQLLDLERMGDKSAQNVITAIAASKDRGLARVLAGLGILDIGVRTAENLAEHFGTMDRLLDASLQQILQAPDMGGGLVEEFRKYQERYPEMASLSLEQLFGLEKTTSATKKWLEESSARGAREKRPSEIVAELKSKGVAAQSLFHFLRSESGQKTIRQLRDLGVILDQPKSVRSGPQPLAGKTIVVTGTLAKFTRGQIKQKIEELGGKSTDSVSKTTSFVLAGEEAGSKLDKAKKLGIEVIDESEFIKRIGG